MLDAGGGGGGGALDTLRRAVVTPPPPGHDEFFGCVLVNGREVVATTEEKAVLDAEQLIELEDEVV